MRHILTDEARPALQMGPESLQLAAPGANA